MKSSQSKAGKETSASLSKGKRTASAKQPPKPAKKPAQQASTGAKESGDSASAAQLIDQRIAELADWRGDTLARMRELILAANPAIIEEWKWSNPVWSHNGIICTGEAYKQVVKLTFARGASIADPAQLFNSSLEGNTRRAIDIRAGEKVSASAFKALVKAAVAQNESPAKKATAKKTTATKTTAKKSLPADKQAKPSAKAATPSASAGQSVKLLSGGNPQIAKADGDTPAQAYIAAMPGWKSALGKRLDAIIVQNAPDVRKAVKWNSPFYGIEGQGWFLSFHVLTRYVKVTFFSGLSLKPIPPGGTTKSKEARWIDIYEDEFDEAQFAAWVKQAAALPGWKIS